MDPVLKSPPPSFVNLAARLQRVLGRWKSALPARTVKSPSKRGVALVVTLLMLSVITIVAVAFLSLSRRGRGNVTQTLNLTDARQAADTALERAIGHTIAPILATTNMLYGDLVVSRNFINTNGFQPGVSSFMNVSYVYPNGLALNQADFLQNLTNLLYDPRPPVFISSNRFGRTAVGAELEFRFYLDLNRNGQFETNGYALPYDSSLGRTVTTNVLFFIGDPEWIGVLEKPNQPHAANNRFIGRYAYIILPVGKSLDLNFIHNQSLQNHQPTLPNTGRFFRKDGFGTYEINLAAFLHALNTNLAFGWGNYFYTSAGPSPGGTGPAFLDALDLVRYRYQGDYNTLDQVQTIFGANAPFTKDKIDGLAHDEFATPEDVPAGFWPGSSSRRHFYSIHDYFDGTKTTNFVARLNLLSSRFNSYDRYTFYRLLSQLNTDTAEDPAQADIPSLVRQISAQRPEQFLADTVGRINLNYDNINYVASDFVNWDPLAFFTNVANILLREQFPFGSANIPLLPATNRWYIPSVHRLLQVAANIYDATTTNAYPTVFLPRVGLVPDPFNPFGPGIVGVAGYNNCLSRPDAVAWAETNGYGLPAVVGVKRGIPNFNEYVFQSAVQITRKLELARKDTTSLPFQTNQIMILALSNVFGVETWNSYSNAFPNSLQVTVTNIVSVQLKNAVDNSVYPSSGPMVFVTGTSMVRVPSAGDTWHFQPGSPSTTLTNGGFLIPLYTNVLVLPPSRYTGITFDGATNSYIRNGQLPVADWRLMISNKLSYIASSPLQGTNRVLDLVCLSYQTNLNLTEFLLGVNSTLPLADQTILAALWNTNRVGTSTPTPSTPTEGINKQLRISLGYEPVSDAFWRAYNPEANDKQSSIQSFLAFVGNNSSNLFQQAPFTASRRFVHTVTWQANDPLVHYMQEDLKDATNNATVRYLKPADLDVFTNNLGRLNQRYQPWSGNPLKEQTDNPDPNDTEVAVKDPGLFGSDDWDFPSQKLPSIGWLGRVHRGTPWQTVYLKAKVASPVQWQRQSLDARTHPTNDWRLLDIFTIAQTPNASHGQLSINQSGLAAWTAVLGGITVLSNLTPNITYPPRAPTAFASMFLDPVASAPVIQGFVDAINRARVARPNQVFRSLGDLMSVPELTTSSPFIKLNGDSPGYDANAYQTYTFNDEVYERIPRQILSLLKVGDARFVIYAFGQSLKPADKSIVTSGPYFGLCTNYQVTGEVSTRTLLKIDRDLTTTNFVLNPKILNHNILPTE